MTRIFLTGSTGQVGWELQGTLITLGEVISVEREISSCGLRIDFSQPDTIRQVVREVQPDLIACSTLLSEN